MQRLQRSDSFRRLPRVARGRATAGLSDSTPLAYPVALRYTDEVYDMLLIKIGSLCRGRISVRIFYTTSVSCKWTVVILASPNWQPDVAYDLDTILFSRGFHDEPPPAKMAFCTLIPGFTRIWSDSPVAGPHPVPCAFPTRPPSPLASLAASPKSPPQKKSKILERIPSALRFKSNIHAAFFDNSPITPFAAQASRHQQRRPAGNNPAPNFLPRNPVK